MNGELSYQMTMTWTVGCGFCCMGWLPERELGVGVDCSYLILCCDVGPTKNQRWVSLWYLHSAQQAQNIWITFVQCRPNVFDVGPTLYKCYTNFVFTGWALLEAWLSVVNKWSPSNGDPPPPSTSNHHPTSHGKSDPRLISRLMKPWTSAKSGARSVPTQSTDPSTYHWLCTNTRLTDPAAGVRNLQDKSNYTCSSHPNSSCLSSLSGSRQGNTGRHWDVSIVFIWCQIISYDFLIIWKRLICSVVDVLYLFHAAVLVDLRWGYVLWFRDSVISWGTVSIWGFK